MIKWKSTYLTIDFYDPYQAERMKYNHTAATAVCIKLHVGCTLRVEF